MRYVLITFFKNSDGAINEQVGFSKRLKSTDNQTCNVIMDYKDRKVLKCVIEGAVVPTSFEQLHEYYSRIYPTLIEQMELANSVATKKPA